jgi:hypothetical protein
LQNNEFNTWYDRNGRIAFTNNHSLQQVGFSQEEWKTIKDKPKGVFEHMIRDDTQPGGPINRHIKYQAPFDKCDREQDYETAWKYFDTFFKNKK